MPAITISGLARAGGVGVETVRYYQRRGLMPVIVRAEGAGAKHYSAGDVQRLCFIRSAQSAGFTLDEIRELLALDAGENRQRARELASERVIALDARITELQCARDALNELVRQCASEKGGPCPILAAFAAKKRGVTRP